MSDKFHVLTIIAHPDDESFLFAGTAMKFLAEGKSVGVICATHGEKGADRLNRKLTEKEMGEIRSQELLKACDILHCDCQKLFDYPDGGLADINFDQLVQDLTAEIEAYQPEIILTFGDEGISGHRDHICIGQAVQASAGRAKHQVREIWLASMPASIIKKFNDHLTQIRVHHKHFRHREVQGVPDDELMMIDIRPYAERKHAALKAHRSQYLPHALFEPFLEYECFKIIRP